MNAIPVQKRTIWRTMCLFTCILLLGFVISFLAGQSGSTPKAFAAPLSPRLPLINSGFVTRSGSQLKLNGQTFRFAGANIQELGMTFGALNYPTPFMIDNAFATMNEMGDTVVRAYGPDGISVGCQLCIEPTPGHFNQAVLQHMDYTITSANEHGIRLIIPLGECLGPY